MKRTVHTFFCFLVLGLLLYGQNSLLDSYIREGLENNLALKQKESSYEKSLQVVKEARGMFYPSLSLSARYSMADGGRIIEFPAGDLLNPVYSTLNELTMSNQFPTVENEEFTFLRPREQETKVQVIQPLFNAGIYHNYRLQNELNTIQFIDAEVYRRYLVAEIKKAYFSYRMTLRLEELARATRELGEENLRVSQKLYDNQKVTKDVMYRSASELSRVDQVIAQAEKEKYQALSFFNFLLNRPLDMTVDEEADSLLPLATCHLETYENQAVVGRGEMTMLEHYIAAAEYNLKINRSRNQPVLLAAVDYGFQGEEYRFTAEDDFVIASFVLRWDLFSGLQGRARVRQAMIDKQMLEQQREELEQQIRLEVTTAFYALKASLQSVRAAGKEAEYARNAFMVTERKYSEGMASLFEYLDSRTAMTGAERNFIISECDLQIKLAELERTTASFDFSRFSK